MLGVPALCLVGAVVLVRLPEYGSVLNSPPLEEGVVVLTPEFSALLVGLVLSVDLDEPAGVDAERPDTDSVLLFPLEGTFAGCVLLCPLASTLEGLAAEVDLLPLLKSGLYTLTVFLATVFLPADLADCTLCTG